MKSTIAMTRPRSAPSSRRVGFTFIEVIVAAAMTALLIGLVGQLLVQLKRHAQRAEEHAIALRTVENSLEELISLPWAEIDDARIAVLPLPAALTARCPAAALTGSVVETSDPVLAKQILLQLALSTTDQPRSVKLTTWIYRTPPTAAVEE